MRTVQKNLLFRGKPRFALFSAIFFLLGIGLGAISQAQTTWTGAGGNDNWFTNTNWDTLLAPNLTTSDVIIGAPSPTVVNGDVNINSLSVTAGGILNVGNSRNFDFGGTATNTLSNQGTINIGFSSDFQFSGSVTNGGSITATHATNQGASDIEVVGSGATIGGGGTITLAGPGGARVMGLSGAILTLNDQTIQGIGQVGADSLGLIINSGGLLNGNSTVGALILDSSLDGVINQGTLMASNGGKLRIQDSVIANTGGSIQAASGSTVDLFNSTISGGTLSGDGTFQVLTGGNSFLADLTHSGTMTVATSTDLGISGTINNTGSITLIHGVNQGSSDLEVQSGGATLDGGGTITLSGTGNLARVHGGTGGSLLIANQTIQGQGNVGGNDLSFTNSALGLINANVAGTLTVDTSAAGATNLGTMQASGGGILRINDSTINNAGGSIQALAGSTVRLENATISGGTLSGAGEFQILTGTNSFLSDLTFSGTMSAVSSLDLGISGTINNTGNITMNHGINQGASDIEVQSGGATLDGGGTITLTGTGNSARINGGTGGTLMIANQTIQGTGNMGGNDLSFTNGALGVIDANSSNRTLTVDANALSFTNNGIMRASNGGTLRFVDAGISNDGIIEAGTGSIVDFDFGVTNNGILRGNGVINLNTNLINNGLISPGASAGTLTMLADTGMTFGSASELLIEIEGAGSGQFDLLDINFSNSISKLTLGGDLVVDLNSYLPSFSDQFVVLTADNTTNLDGPDLMGMFANVANGGTLTTFGGEGYFTVSYGSFGNPNQVLLSNFVLTVPEPGGLVMLCGLSLIALVRRKRA